MFVHYRTQGLIIKKRNRGENNQLFTVYTKDFGKLEVLGKAIRKITSKLRAGAELFYLSEVEFIQGKNYKTLTDAILLDSFPEIRKNLLKLKIAYRAAEVLDNLTPLEEKDPKIWDLLRRFFYRLNKLETENSLKIVYPYFLWNFFCLLGYEPELYLCAICQKKLVPEKLYFSAIEGGVICLRCKKTVKSAREISPATIKILRLFLKKDWQTLERLKVEEKDQKLLNSISAYYIAEYWKESK